jgi:two-component system response regulator GlrR
MPLPLQVKLLRVLQEKEVRPLGATLPRAIDVRIISATHRDLLAEVGQGRFREDLYYRLNVIGLQLPPLADRREDVPLLAQQLLLRTAREYGKELSGFAPEAMERLVAASWPGNVRQLANVVEQVVALCTGSIVPPALVEQAIREADDAISSFDEARDRFERDYLTQLLKITEGNASHAARLAKRNRTDFYKLLARHKLEASAFKAGKRST